MPLLDPFLQDILRCPQCKSALRDDEAASELVCEGCGLAFPVREGIPVMLLEEARKPPVASDVASDEG